MLEIDSQRFLDPNIRLSHVHATSANDDLSCIREGGYRHWSTYQIWEWSALNWLQETMRDQLMFELSGDLISVWPALDRYCLNLYGTDIFYDMKHSEVLGDAFNPKRVLNQMRAVRFLEKKDRPSIF